MWEQEYSYARPRFLEESIRRYRPGGWETFTSSVEEGFMQTPMMQAIEWAMYNNPRDKRLVSTDEFQAIVGGLPISYEEGMTVSQVELLTKVHRREEAYGWFNRNVGMWEPTRIGGFLLGSLPDPLNLMPMGGVITRLGTTARLMSRGVGIGIESFTKPIGNILEVGATGALLAATAEFAVIVPKKAQFQQEWGIRQGLIDVAFAAAAGSTLASFAYLAPAIINAPKHFKLGALTKVSKDIGDGELGSVMPDDYNPRGPNDPFQPAGPRYPEHGIEPSSIARQASEDANRRLSWAKREGDAARANETVELFEEGLGTAIDSVVTPEFQSKLVNFTGSVVNRTADEFEKIVNYAASCWRKGQ